MSIFIQSYYDKNQKKFGSIKVSCLKEGTMSLPSFNLLVKNICIKVCESQISDFDILFSKHKEIEEMIVKFDKEYVEDIGFLQIII